MMSENTLEVDCSECGQRVPEFLAEVTYEGHMCHNCFLDYKIKNAGCEAAFKPIVASEKNASQPHHDTYDEKLGKEV